MSLPKEGSRETQDGLIIAVPHDWCKSPGAPVPYKVWAKQIHATNLANSVRQTDCRSHVLGSIVMNSYGDDPGIGGGVKSGTLLAECTPMSYSPTVRAEGRPMVRFLDKWWMNHKNTWGELHNAQDTGNYGLPKVKLIDPKMQLNSNAASLSSSTEGGTLVASAAATTLGPSAASGSGFGEVAGQIGRGAVSAGKWVGGAIEDVGIAAEAGTAVLAGGFLLMMTTSTAKDEDIVRVTQKTRCPPCKTVTNKIVAPGTIGYLLHLVPPSKPHYPLPGDHYNLFEAHQNPNNCQCFWKPLYKKSHAIYKDGTSVKIGDIVEIGGDKTGEVVIIIDSNESSPNFDLREWAYLKSGVLVKSQVGLIHYELDQIDMVKLIANQK